MAINQFIILTRDFDKILIKLYNAKVKQDIYVINLKSRKVNILGMYTVEV